MKKVIIIGFPDVYILKLTNFLQKHSACKEVLKVYTSFQFFRDYKKGNADIIFLDSFSRDSEITGVGKKIRELDSDVRIIGMSNNSNVLIKEQFKNDITEADYIFKTKNNDELVKKTLESKSENIEAKPTSVKHASKTILVVDDFENTLNVIKYTLEKSNFKVITANSGQEALKLFDNDMKPDIIITDLNMPKMDGFELIENMRKNYDVEGIPIFLLTTEFNFKKKLRAKELNITGWIQKPYNSNEFIQIITKALE